ncbi:MAG: LacI family DNA-binding transcriptional regulator [Nostocoides sp.]
MSTITDVAKAAGVSVATVSRALRGLDRVSPQTRAKVEKVATELNFVASPTATSLASGRTRVVAVVAPFLTRWFFATLVSAIDRTLREQDHHVLLFDLEDDSYDRRMHLTQNMLWKRADGVITLNLPVDDVELALLDRLGLPVVAIGSPLPGRPLVQIDDRRAVRLATEHLIELGHSRIGYIGAVPVNAAHVQTPRTRLDSFETTMAAHGLRFRPDWVVASDWTADAAATDIVRVLLQPDRPTGIVAASDEIAIGVMQAARRLGIRVPGDLSVVGIDDHTLSAVMDLTTVRQDVTLQGRTAARLLLDVLDDEDGFGARAVTIPIELIVRSSTAPPAPPA